MDIGPGTRLGAYEILSALGAGGMGEVYRAHDTRLKRDVALKILPDRFAADADRLARFRREAEALASLNHPNIAAIYGLEDASSRHALVLELVDGPTLAERIAKGPIALDDIWPLARADDRGPRQRRTRRGSCTAISSLRTSRSTGDGRVKILDFGLAKVFADAARRTRRLAVADDGRHVDRIGGRDPRHGRLHEPGAGARAAVDNRADIWAFGCVLYEMLTGRRGVHG